MAQATTPTRTPADAAARLAALQAAETKALTAVSSAATALEKKREKHAETRARLEREEAEHTKRLETAQGAYAAIAGPERAGLVLGISVTAARELAKAHETDHRGCSTSRPCESGGSYFGTVVIGSSASLARDCRSTARMPLRRTATDRPRSCRGCATTQPIRRGHRSSSHLGSTSPTRCSVATLPGWCRH